MKPYFCFDWMSDCCLKLEGKYGFLGCAGMLYHAAMLDDEWQNYQTSF
jgi:hypothetical protein